MPLWYPLSSARSAEERRSVSRPQESCEHDANIDAQYEQGLQCSESVVASKARHLSMVQGKEKKKTKSLTDRHQRGCLGHRTVATHPLAL